MATTAQHQLGHSTTAKHLETQWKSKFTLGPNNICMCMYINNISVLCSVKVACSVCLKIYIFHPKRSWDVRSKHQGLKMSQYKVLWTTRQPHSVSRCCIKNTQILIIQCFVSQSRLSQGVKWGNVIIINERKTKDPLKELYSELIELYCVHSGTQEYRKVTVLLLIGRELLLL